MPIGILRNPKILKRLVACAHKVVFAEQPMRVENRLLRYMKDMEYERGSEVVVEQEE